MWALLLAATLLGLGMWLWLRRWHAARTRGTRAQGAAFFDLLRGMGAAPWPLNDIPQPQGNNSQVLRYANTQTVVS